ncbi:MAG: molybdopterin-binding protein [Albidovulum sp.]|nr:molybdopterin-binding protein [Albidovulum sp.]
MNENKLAGDCFALPRGFHWTPVDEALAGLRASLAPVVDTERIASTKGAGRILAEAPIAERSNPASTNSAVDGYGFAYASLDGSNGKLQIAAGRSAAGRPWKGTLPTGFALRILTGATVPEGMDTVVLDEDVELRGSAVEIPAGVKPGSNTRAEAEDVRRGQELLSAGKVIWPQDVALLTASGVKEVSVRKTLRVAVLSTGDELRQLNCEISPGQVYDANRPMILSIAARWGHAVVDMGTVEDDPGKLRLRLDRAVELADAVMVSGGASGGDEDHVSALLSREGILNFWRVAIKPGRPLALSLWRGKPVIGLPGNPVAAFVCALIFGRPILRTLAGGAWQEPIGYLVPAAFSKFKKRGRREYLRARLDAHGRAESFRSEGSGLISGLSWSDGLVELADEARTIQRGDIVKYIPYSNFGL